MITMSELAKKAGVSQATVSRVLNGSATVSPATKANVMEWVRKLDFQPNSAARTLASKRTYLIGLVLPDALNPYFTEIVYHIEKIAAMNGFNVIFCNSDGSEIRETEILKSLKARQVEGILLGFVKENSRLIDDIFKSNIESVVITQTHDDLDSVSVSHLEGGHIAAKHLMERGCKRFIYIGNVDDDKYMGYLAELNSSGYSDEYIDHINCGIDWSHTSQKSYSESINYIKNSLFSGKIGVFATNDFLSVGFLNAANDLNAPIPDKYSIVGFDDTYICQTSRPTLTSIAQPKEDIGRIAINRLLDKLVKKTATQLKQDNIVLDPQLIKREST